MPEESSYSSCFFFPPSPSASVKFNFKNIFFILFIFVLTVTYLNVHILRRKTQILISHWCVDTRELCMRVILQISILTSF